MIILPPTTRSKEDKADLEFNFTCRATAGLFSRIAGQGVALENKPESLFGFVKESEIIPNYTVID